MNEKKMSIKTRGFATMDKNKLLEISSKGGKNAHSSGRAHKWTVEEAIIAGRKGGINSRKKKKKDNNE